MENMAKETQQSDNGELAEQAEQTSGADAASETTRQTAAPTDVKEKSRRWLPYVIAAGVLAVLTLLCGWLFGGYVGGNAKELVGDWSSSFAVPGVVCLGTGLLIWCGNEGAFDMLSYGIKSLFRLFRKDVRDRKYGGFYEYRKAREEKKKPFLYMVVVGGAYTLVGVILIIIYSQL